MVDIVIKYTAEELTPKAQKFYCGAGLVKCQITGSEKGLSRFHTEEKPKEEVLKVHYVVADGEYKGAENTVEFELWDDSLIDFGNGKNAPASKLAAQNFMALSVAAGFESFVSNSTLLHGKMLLVNHEIRKGGVIEEMDDYGNKTPKLDANGQPEHYPDESVIVKRGKKFARVNNVAQPSVTAPAMVAQPVAPAVAAPAAPIAAPVAATVVAQPAVAAPAPVTYVAPPAHAPAVDDEIPWV